MEDCSLFYHEEDKSRMGPGSEPSDVVCDSQRGYGGNSQPRESELHKSHLIQTLQALQYVRALEQGATSDPDDLVSMQLELQSKLVDLPPLRPGISKTVVFDLDETLVHCVDDPATQHPDVVLNVTFPSGETIGAGINVRPYALECLRAANEHF